MSTEAVKSPAERKSDHNPLFVAPDGSAGNRPVAGGEPLPGGRPRVQRVDRQQVVLRMAALDDLLGQDHVARVVWEYVQGLPLEELYQGIRAVEGHAGREPIDPRILLALWLYGTLEGVGSARELDRLCREHVAFQWLCGGVSVNYHTLADFRTGPVELLDRLLTQSVTTLMHEGLVSLQRVAQDGMRVRASAGAASFRRGPTLAECQAEAQEQVEALRKELEADPGACSKRQAAARQRAARERSERIQRALQELPQVEAAKPPGKKEQARASTTDPEARVMKMADGGFRPALNVQFATDTAGQVITGVAVSNRGSDQGQMAPMVRQHQDRYRQAPAEVLVDGGFAKHQDIELVSSPEVGVVVYAPVPKSRTEAREAHTPRETDSPEIAQWRQRMGTPRAQEIYKERAATAECVNAIARNRGMHQFVVRGVAKALTVVLWFALAHNLMRAVALRAQAALAVG